MDPQLLLFAGTLLVTGIITGYAAGLFGIGGGSIMVPVLYFVFSYLGVPNEILMHCAVGTSSAVIIIGSLRSVRTHHQHGAVDWNLLWPGNPIKSWGLWIAAGSLFAAWYLGKRLSGNQLSLIFGVVAFIISLQFIFGRPNWKLRDNVPGGIALPIGGGGIGMISSLMGIGGGALSVSLMLMCAVPIKRAIATASGIGAFISIPATIGWIISGWGVQGRPDFSVGYVNIIGFVFIALSLIFVVPYGARATHKMDQNKLRKVFGVFLLLVAINMIRKAVL